MPQDKIIPPQDLLPIHALGGGHGLLAHGLVQRPTEDVDLFTDVERGVRAATDLVQSALTGAGFRVATPPETSELTDLIYGMDDAFEEMQLSDGSAAVSVSLARLARHRAAFAPYGLDAPAVSRLREQFAEWPRK